MTDKKIHKGYRLSNDTVQQLEDISNWLGDIDQTQVLTIAVAELWHRKAGEIYKTRDPHKRDPQIKNK